MIYAFDWGGTLNVNPELMNIAEVLLEEGHEVHVISVAWPHEKREERLQKYQQENNIYFSGVHVIIETGSTQHGEEKVRIMKQLNCRVIFDDNQDVINKAREAGMLGIKIPYKDH